MRNHGFIYKNKGWQLSPAYDLNPIPSSQGLHLNITDSDNRLDFSLAFDVLDFFQLTQAKANKIYDEVLSSVKTWEIKSQAIGISKQEQEKMKFAFRC